MQGSIEIIFVPTLTVSRHILEDNTSKYIDRIVFENRLYGSDIGTSESDGEIPVSPISAALVEAARRL